MTLTEWANLHRDEVIAEPTSSQEIGNLLALMERELKDADSPLSLDGRFAHAFWACLTAARIALRADGYRLRSTAHHYRAIESLEYTLDIAPRIVSQLQAFRAKRAQVEYDMVDFVTTTEFNEVQELAGELKKKLLEWLRTEHNDLV